MKSFFGENLKRERIAANLSQKEFAAKIGTTQQLLSRWECGEVEPSLGNIILILRILNIRFEDLVDVEKYDTENDSFK